MSHLIRHANEIKTYVTVDRKFSEDLYVVLPRHLRDDVIRRLCFGCDGRSSATGLGCGVSNQICRLSEGAFKSRSQPRTILRICEAKDIHLGRASGGDPQRWAGGQCCKGLDRRCGRDATRCDQYVPTADVHSISSSVISAYPRCTSEEKGRAALP